MCISRRQRGLTLIELIVFIVIVSVALAGVLTVLNVTTSRSADPMIRKQMLAVAEAMLEEVMSQPFTFCAPSDANAATATGATTSGSTINCATTVQGLGAGGSARIANTDNVGDYASVTLNPVTSVDGSYTLAGYSAAITLTPENLGPAAAQITSAACTSASDCTALNVLRIAVTVTHGSDSITLEGYRARNSPNLLP